MSKNSKKSGKSKSKIDRDILLAVIALIGTVIAALLASPLLPALVQRTAPAATNAPTALTPFILLSTVNTDLPAPNLIQPTRTSAPSQNPITDTPITSPTTTSIASATVIAQPPTQTVSPPVATSISIPECRFNNLINCSIYIPFPKSNATGDFDGNGNMVVNFNNQQIGSGVAFQFTPPLDVNGFPRVEVRGTSTTTFSFVIEYKLKARKWCTNYDFPSKRISRNVRHTSNSSAHHL